MAAARAELGLPSGQRILLAVGSLIPRKGIDLMVKALAILRGELGHGDLNLVVVGDGPHEAALRRLIASLGLDGAVRLVGSVSHEKLRVWYSAADLFCLSSAREGWPNVLLESMACGTPVVATGVWGVPEVIRSDDGSPGGVASGESPNRWPPPSQSRGNASGSDNTPKGTAGITLPDPFAASSGRF
jgi:glycosyltransferase involved in cell wall biosynthesis